MIGSSRRWRVVAAGLALMLMLAGVAQAQSETETFPQTGETVSGAFLRQ